jgi:hypothetical protein
LRNMRAAASLDGLALAFFRMGRNLIPSGRISKPREGRGRGKTGLGVSHTKAPRGAVLGPGQASTPCRSGLL